VGVRAESGILNQALREARQARVALGRLIGLVDIVDEASHVEFARVEGR
jgi:hypothetical protein